MNPKETNYSNMSPVDLNSQLRKIYDSLPVFSSFARQKKTEETPNITNIIDNVLKGLKRRDRSEHKEILIGKLTIVLEFSPTSHSFKQYVIEKFSLSYDSGVPKDIPLEEQEKFFVGLGILAEDRSGGIFDPNSAQWIERRSLLNTIREEIVMDEEISNTHISDEADREYENNALMQNPIETRLYDWLQDYLQHYHIDQS